MRDFDRSLHNNWDRELESDLPDSRLRGPTRRATTLMRGRLEFERVFCANCGKPSGMVIANASPHVFFVCDDEACLKFVTITTPGAVQASPEEERRLRGEAQNVDRST
jgi:hypothetical protein